MFLLVEGEVCTSVRMEMRGVDESLSTGMREVARRESSTVQL